MAADPRSSALSRRRFLSTVGSGAAALWLGACSAQQEQPTAAGATAPAPGDPLDALAGRTVRVATFPSNHVAAALFWPMFAPEGATVEVSTVASGAEMNLALEGGDLDFATFGVVNGFVQAAEGLGSAVIGMAARQGAGLVVRNDAPFTAVADLRGARIGIKDPSFQSLLVFRLLDEAGLDPQADVEIVPVEWNDMPTALEAGDVDAFMGTEPNPSRSVATGIGRRLVNPYTTPIGSLNSALWASPSALEDADLCRAAVELQRQSAEFLSPGGTNDPGAWEDLVVGQFGLEEAVYRELLSNVGAVWRLDGFWLDQARAAGAEMAELGVLDAEPDYDALLRTDYQPDA